MSLAEIKDEIAKLSPEELAELRREVFRDPIYTPEYQAEMARRQKDMEEGRNIVTKEELYARLRAAGKQV